MRSMEFLLKVLKIDRHSPLFSPEKLEKFCKTLFIMVVKFLIVKPDYFLPFGHGLRLIYKVLNKLQSVS